MLACIRATWYKHEYTGPPIGRAMLYMLAVLAARALRAYLVRQESIVYKHAYEAALEASL